VAPQGKVTSRRRKALLVLAGVCAGAVVAPPGLAAAEKLVDNVFITNTPEQPVPVAGTVNVGNLPASQEVTGTVNVGNLPATQAVTLDQSAGPIGVAVGDHAPAEPFHEQSLINATADGFDFVELLEVPEGKTAVIETVSASIIADTGNVPELFIDTQFFYHFVAFDQQSAVSDPANPDATFITMFIATETLHLDAGPGTTVDALLTRRAATVDPARPRLFGVLNVSGYFVDTPATGGP
jgi:hypothetical protein